MKVIADWIMNRRARRLAEMLTPFLPTGGMIADIGSGTGHNASAIRNTSQLVVREFDVADIHWVGPSPTMITEDSILLEDSVASMVLVLYVLHYCVSPELLMSEVVRITNGDVVVLQTTYQGSSGRNLLKVQEFFLVDSATFWLVLRA